MTTITSFATAVDITISELKLETFVPTETLTPSVLFAQTLQPGRAATREG